MLPFYRDRRVAAELAAKKEKDAVVRPLLEELRRDVTEKGRLSTTRLGSDDECSLRPAFDPPLHHVVNARQRLLARASGSSLVKSREILRAPDLVDRRTRDVVRPLKYGVDDAIVV